MRPQAKRKGKWVRWGEDKRKMEPQPNSQLRAHREEACMSGGRGKEWPQSGYRETKHFITFHLFNVCSVDVCVHVYAYTYVTGHMWRSEDN